MAKRMKRTLIAETQLSLFSLTTDDNYAYSVQHVDITENASSYVKQEQLFVGEGATHERDGAAENQRVPEGVGETSRYGLRNDSDRRENRDAGRTGISYGTRGTDSGAGNGSLDTPQWVQGNSRDALRVHAERDAARSTEDGLLGRDGAVSNTDRERLERASGRVDGGLAGRADSLGDTSRGQSGENAAGQQLPSDGTRDSNSRVHSEQESVVLDATSIDEQIAHGELDRAQKNVAALRVLNELRESEVSPTAEQVRILAGYSGWGGASKAFEARSTTENWATVYREVKHLLGEEDYADAAASTLTAFYTPRPVVEAMWQVLKNAGVGTVRHANILEPGCGTGNFMRAMPKDINADVYGIELDPTSAEIAEYLTPKNAHIINADFEDCGIADGSFDAVIGNVPYSENIKFNYKGRNLSIHDYFIKRSIEAVRPGGVVAVITSRYTLDKFTSHERQDLLMSAEIVGAVRLPEETFATQAGTSVISDVLVFRKREKVLDEVPANDVKWLEIGTFGEGERSFGMNAGLLEDVSAHSVGTLEVGLGPFGYAPRIHLQGVSQEVFGQELNSKFSSQITAVRYVEMSKAFTKKLPEPTVSVKPKFVENYELSVAEDGGIWYGDKDTVVAFEPQNIKDLPRVRGLLHLRDGARELIAMEADSKYTDEQIQAKIQQLNDAYDRFVMVHGRVSNLANRRVSRPKIYQDASLTTSLLSLEVLDGEGRFVRKADILQKRVISPVKPVPEHVEHPSDALALSMNQKGNFDPDYVAGLLDIPVSTLGQVLGDLIVKDPATESYVLADEYLSGDVVEKLEYVQKRLYEAENTLKDQRVKEIHDRIGLVEHLTKNATIREEINSRTQALSMRHIYQGIVKPLSSNEVGKILVSNRGDFADAFEPSDAYSSPMPRNYAIGNLIATADRYPDGKIAAINEVFILFRNNIRRRYRGTYESGSEAQNTQISPESTMSWGFWKILDTIQGNDELLARFVTTALKPSFQHYDPCPFVRALQSALGQDYKDFDESSYFEALRNHPYLGEYMFMLETQHGFNPSLCTLDGLEHYEVERANKVKVTPDELDQELISDLRSLEKRLIEAQPEKIPFESININLGNAWIPPYYVMQFMTETFDLRKTRYLGDMGGLTVSFSELTGQWQVKGKETLSTAMEEKYSTSEVDAFKLVESLLNGRSPIVMKTIRNKDGESVKVVDTAQTRLAWNKREAIETAFQNWVWKDPDRSAYLEHIYNHRFNRIKVRKYTGELFETPGIANGVELRPHQKDAVARVLQSTTGTLFGHTVGAGKTFAGITAMHESKRIGRATKPLCVVPNSLTEQFAADWLRLYPNDKLLVMTKNDMSKADAVQEFWGRARSGNWDGIICSHSRFTMLGLSPEVQVKALKVRADEIADNIRDLEESAGKKSFTIKKAQGVLARVERQVKQAHENSKKEKGIYFDDIGVDMLVVDEAHEFKNLGIYGMEVSGMSTSGSAKADDLLFKCNWLREQGHGSNIVFMTGTPITNSMGELYNMERFLAPDLLTKSGLISFPSWALTYGHMKTDLEQAPEGGIRTKTRFKQFQNLPELLTEFHVYSDVITKKMVNLPLPKLISENIVVDATYEQKKAMEWIVERAEKIHEGSVDAWEDNMLNITTDGRKVALDPLLLKEKQFNTSPLQDGKVQVCAEKVYEIWKKGADTKATQLVFCDSSTDAAKGKFNIYDDLRSKLAALGIPQEQIASIGDAQSDKAKKALFDKVNAGDIRVLLGSTSKLGTGVNVQERLLAVHHLDCPWRPSDIEQRNGRIERQGNMFSEVYAFTYTTKGTFDSYMYQTLERKQLFISQVFTDKNPARVADDIDDQVMGYRDVVRATTSDPSVYKLTELRQNVDVLKLEQSAFLENRATYNRKLLDWNKLTVTLKDRLDVYKAHESDLKAALDVAPLVEAEDVEPVREKFFNTSVPLNTPTVVGQYRGLQLVKEVMPPLTPLEPPAIYVGILPASDSNAKHSHMAERCIYANARKGRQLLKQVDELIEVEANIVPYIEDRLTTLHKQIAEATEIVSRAWDKAEELSNAEAELRSFMQKVGLNSNNGAMEVEASQSSEVIPAENVEVQDIEVQANVQPEQVLAQTEPTAHVSSSELAPEALNSPDETAVPTPSLASASAEDVKRSIFAARNSNNNENAVQEKPAWSNEVSSGIKFC